MTLADFQNPLANMPLMQQMQQAQSMQAQFAPSMVGKTFEDEVREELNTVQETNEQQGKDRINEEDTQRGDIRKQRIRRRAKRMEEEPEEPAAAKPRVRDGIHGNLLDIQA
ncbi:MAG: hypothetical protein AB1656_03890 [Candidatus Omnitrophota bacterium]